MTIIFKIIKFNAFFLHWLFNTIFSTKFIFPEFLKAHHLKWVSSENVFAPSEPEQTKNHNFLLLLRGLVSKGRFKAPRLAAQYYELQMLKKNLRAALNPRVIACEPPAALSTSRPPCNQILQLPADPQSPARAAINEHFNRANAPHLPARAEKPRYFSCTLKSLFFFLFPQPPLLRSNELRAHAHIVYKISFHAVVEGKNSKRPATGRIKHHSITTLEKKKNLLLPPVFFNKLAGAHLECLNVRYC